MRQKYRHARKPDPVVVACCALVLISCLGAIGRQGRQRAKEIVCLANLQQWGSMFETYTEDHDGNFNPGWNMGETTLWMNALRPYYQDQWSLLLCPAATKSNEFGAEGTFSAWTRTTYDANGDIHRDISSYGINSWTNCMTQSRGSRLEELFWKSTRDVETPANVPVFADALWHDSWPQPTDAPLPLPIDLGGGNMGTFGEINHSCIDRHNGGVNLLFMDWSARKVGLKELWTLKWHRQFNTAGPWTTAGGVQLSDWPEWMRDFKDY